MVSTYDAALPYYQVTDVSRFLTDYKLLVANQFSKSPNFATFLKQATKVAEEDAVRLNHLDLNGIRVIAQVLAQTVAMEHYEEQVSEMLGQFSDYNNKIHDTGVLNIPSKYVFEASCVSFELFCFINYSAGQCTKTLHAITSL